MKRVLPFVVALSLPAVAVTMAPLRAQEELGIGAVPAARRAAMPALASGDVIVQFRGAMEPRTAEREIWSAGGARARRSSFGERYLVSVDQGFNAADVIARFRQMPDVDYAEASITMHAFQRGTVFSPNDRFYRNQWNMRMIDAERTWGIQKGDPSVAVAVVDSGVAYEDFGPYRKAPDWGATVFLPGRDFINNDDHPNDDEGHGTHVASTIAEATNNDLGVTGLAFNCAILPVKVLGRDGSGSDFAVAEGIDFATTFMQGGQHPVKVINLSLGGEGDSETIRRAIDRAVQAGVTVVAAAGNENEGTVGFPARLPNVIAVGAVGTTKKRASYSNFGSALDLVAPGGDLLTAAGVLRDDDGDGLPDGILQQTFSGQAAAAGNFGAFAYFYLDGTSQATPHVSAAAALLYRQGITSPAAIQKALEITAEDLGTPGRDDTFGFGLIRPVRALTGQGLNSSP